VDRSLLVLFDIDGTLLLDDEYAHGRAMVRAMRDVWGVDLPDDVVRRVDPWGKTDLRIAREAVATAGVGEAGFRERQAAWIGEASCAFQDVAEAVADRWLMREGVASALARLAESRMRLTLLTGNLRPIAEEKIMRMGLLQYVELAIGAYGDDAEERAELVPLARRRAGTPAHPWPRGATVIVGDAPGDVAAAGADSVASVVFASRRFTREALVGATVVVDDTEELVTALLRHARK
jgi:phosphoglycolate phosphatase-like HAD superfamily hydrolase